MREAAPAASRSVPSVEQAYNAACRSARGTVWNTGGCASWYIDANGKNTTIWPDFTFRFRRRTREFDEGDYVVTRAGSGTEKPQPALT